MVTRTYRVRGFSFGNELYHYGILGQKWGVRRFQNPDGTLTSAGKERYKDSSESSKKSDLKSVLAKEKEYRSEKHSANKEAVEKYYSEAEFAEIKAYALELGFAGAACGPLVRSSYRAGEMAEKVYG